LTTPRRRRHTATSGRATNMAATRRRGLRVGE
jgi:hypothetical protein